MTVRQTLITEYFKPLYMANMMSVFTNRFSAVKRAITTQKQVATSSRQTLITDYYYIVPKKTSFQSHITNYFQKV